MIFGEDTDTSTIGDTFLWGLSSWDEENINDLQRKFTDMRTLGVLQRSSGAITDEGVEDDLHEVVDDTFTSRRLRSHNSPPQLQGGGESSSSSGSSSLEKQKQQEKKWEDEANGMEGEIMKYFLKETGNKKQQQKKIQKMDMGGPKRPDPKANSNNKVTQRSATAIDREQRKNSVVDNTQRNVQQQYTLDNPFSPNCTDPNAALECPPEDLPQKCDRYNGGNMKDCYQRCKVSFCCIHDSKSRMLAPSCSREVNCKNWHPCYIVWWKLHDTIGPMSYVRIAQNESFYNVNFQYILEDNTIDDGAGVSPFYLQWFFHHFDDDSFKTDMFVEDPANW